MANAYAKIVTGLAFMGLMSCANDKGKATLAIHDGTNGAPDTLFFSSKANNDRYTIVSDTNQIMAKDFSVALREDIFNGGFFFEGAARRGKGVADDYFINHYDIAPEKLNPLLVKTFIPDFSWNDAERIIYLNYVAE
jgi:hypothetical protein